MVDASSDEKDTIFAAPPREIAPGVWWITECLAVPVSGVMTHVHTSPYVVKGSEKALIWDTANPSQWTRVDKSLDDILGDRPIDYIIPSHPEVAHFGNTLQLLKKYPNAQIVGDVRDYGVYFPDHVDRLLRKAPGEALDLGSHRFVFVEGLIKDLVNTQWGFETTTRTMFVADSFAYSHQAPIDDDDRPTHLEGECALLASELGKPPAEEQVVWITKAALYWTHFVPLDLFLNRFQEILKQHPPTLVAPAHGAVIDDIDEVLWLIWNALKKSYDPLQGVARASLSTRDRD
ncbi:MAG: hypothetical protein QM602_08120 [Microbacterium sp.]